MIKVQVRPNEPLEAALRRFKRQCNYAGIFRLAKKYSFYEKRSDRRRREERERIRNIQRAMRKAASRVLPKSRRKSRIRAGGGRPQGSEGTSTSTSTETPAATKTEKPAEPVAEKAAATTAVKAAATTEVSES